MDTAGAALQIMDQSTKKGTTTMNQLADTIRITFKQHINGFGHGLLKSHANIPVRSLSSTRCPREHPRDHVRSATMFLSQRPVNQCSLSTLLVRAGRLPLMLRISIQNVHFIRHTRQTLVAVPSLRSRRQQYHLYSPSTCQSNLVPQGTSLH